MIVDLPPPVPGMTWDRGLMIEGWLSELAEFDRAVAKLDAQLVVAESYRLRLLHGRDSVRCALAAASVALGFDVLGGPTRDNT